MKESIMPIPRYIMIVDDNPANLKLLEDMLSQQGYEVRSFLLGSMAMAAAIKHPPSLFLLDINMPEMNGYELCERLKSIQQLFEIPIIFLSALSEIEDKIKAFRSGAVDYISKPFQFEEVQARVETHLKLHDLQRSLQRQNEQLETAVAARTIELSRAMEQLRVLDRSKSDFLNLISHEFRTPLNGLLGAGEMLMQELPSSPVAVSMRRLYARSRRKILSILDDAVFLAEIDVGNFFKSGPVSLTSALNRAIEGAADFAKDRSVTILPLVPDCSLVIADQSLLVRALRGLLETAVKFARAGSSLQLSLDLVGDSRTVVVETQGLEIAGPALPKFFEIFAIGEPITVDGGDLGLAAPVAYRILSLFGGSVSVANRDHPPGIRFTVLLKDDASKQCDAQFTSTSEMSRPHPPGRFCRPV
jgi:two-component system, sensor histidine kinase and response regulator